MIVIANPEQIGKLKPEKKANSINYIFFSIACKYRPSHPSISIIFLVPISLYLMPLLAKLLLLFLNCSFMSCQTILLLYRNLSFAVVHSFCFNNDIVQSFIARGILNGGKATIKTNLYWDEMLSTKSFLYPSHQTCLMFLSLTKR